MEINLFFIGILILYILLSINAGLRGELTGLITAILSGFLLILLIYTSWSLGILYALKYLIISVVITWFLPITRLWKT